MWTYYCIVWFDTYQHNQYKHPFTKGQALNVTCITLLGLVIIWGQRILQRGHKIFWQHVNSLLFVQIWRKFSCSLDQSPATAFPSIFQ